MDEVKCLKCGKCCHYDVNGTIHKCKHLISIGSRTHCRIYNKKDRIGTVIYKDEKYNYVCGPRSGMKETYPGCPYNQLIEEKNE